MTPTPPFPVEPKPKKISGSYIKNRTSPQEAIKNRMSVGGLGSKPLPYCFWQPHNYRLYIDFDKTTLKLPSDNETALKTAPYRTVNSTEICFDSFQGCRIVIKQRQVEITNLINPRWYKIQLAPETAIEPQFQEIIQQKDKECLDTLRAFIAIYGGSSEFHILNARSEDKIMAEEKIDQLPEKMTFHADIVKKVYNEHNVEFSTPAGASTYLRTRAIEKIAPELAEQLRLIRVFIGMEEPKGGYFYTSIYI
jgi:hypothetical protein